MEYWDALQKYYELKARYMGKVKQAQDRVVKQTDIPIEERRKMFKELRPKCEKCKREGGTLFFQENRTLIAKCGNPEPCDLDIQIYTGTYTNYSKQLKDTKKEYELDVNVILESKYNLLFQYVTEEDVKVELSKMKKSYMNNKTKYDTQLGEWVKVISNPEIVDTLREDEVKLSKAMNVLHHTMMEYKKNPMSEILRDIIAYYKTDVIPIVSEIRKLKYKESVYEFKTGATHEYSDTIYDLKDLEIMLDPPKIISNKI